MKSNFVFYFKNKVFILKIMDFDVEIFKLPDQNSTAIKITTNNGKTNSTVIKNREFEADNQSLVSQTVFKLVCATMKELVKEKMEEKCIELSTRTGRPRSKKSKRIIMTQ
jgi:hypothetical protein